MTEGDAVGAEAGEGGTLAPLIDHTALEPGTPRSDVDHLCEEAVRFGFAAVCVHPCHVERVARELEGSGVAPATVVAFPLGAQPAAAKAREAEELVGLGAVELDVVARIGAVKEARWDVLEEEVRAVVEASGPALVKVILETAALEPRETVKAARVATLAGADFLKTSTGFHPAGGATVEAVALLRLAGGPEVGVKAAGGIRSTGQALGMVAAGASRLGTSRALELVGCAEPLPEPLHDYLGERP